MNFEIGSDEEFIEMQQYLFHAIGFLGNSPTVEALIAYMK